MLTDPNTSLLPALSLVSPSDLLDSDSEDELLPRGGVLASGLEDEEDEDSFDLEP